MKIDALKTALFLRSCTWSIQNNSSFKSAVCQ